MSRENWVWLGSPSVTREERAARNNASNSFKGRRIFVKKSGLRRSLSTHSPASVLQNHLIHNLSAEDTSPPEEIVRTIIELFVGHQPSATATFHVPSLLSVHLLSAFYLIIESLKFKGRTPLENGVQPCKVINGPPDLSSFPAPSLCNCFKVKYL